MSLLERISKQQLGILQSLMNENYYIETDGDAFWMVTPEHGYSALSKESVRGLIAKNMLKSNRIDDETSRYFMTEAAQAEMDKKALKPKSNSPTPKVKSSPISPKEAMERDQLKTRMDRVKGFLNLR